MAKQRRRNRGAASSRSSISPNRGVDLGVSVGTQRTIIAIILWFLALISILSLFHAAGSFGLFWSEFLMTFFGWGGGMIPVVLIALGFLTMNFATWPSRGATYFGIFLSTISVLGLLHAWIGPGNLFEKAQAGSGGGYIGAAVSYPLVNILGVVGAYVALIVLLAIGIVLILNKSARELLAMMRGQQIGASDEDEEELEDADEEGFRTKEAKTPLDVVKAKETLAKLTAQVESQREKMAEKAAAEKAAALRASQSGLVKKDAMEVRVPKALDRNWSIPGVDLLEPTTTHPASGDIKANAKIIQQTLSNFNIPVEMGDVFVGPTVTQYTLRPDPGVKLTQIVSLSNDLALALAAHPIRIEAPIPGKSLVGIEVPNVSIATVRLRELFESDLFKKRTSILGIAVGRDVAGGPVIVDLAKMPHLLIAGATGSGKSVAINTMLLSLLYQHSPRTMRLILVDPKRVELSHYNNIPHLLTPVITDVKKTIQALRWVVGEMDRRYQTLAADGKRNIEGFNGGSEEPMPYIVVVVDELADLMAVAANEVEGMIVRLAQMARAVGIHLVLATQRPSVDVITGLIKANITSRMAFNVASTIDSRTIIDSSGAEKLLGNGDMLFISSDLSKPRRVQGAFVAEKEVEKVTEFLKRQELPEFDQKITEQSSGGAGAGEGGNGDDDPMLEDAKRVVVQAQKASASLLQRRLSVGYARAARLLDILEERGIIGPGEGAKPREVYISREELGMEDGVTLEEGEGESTPTAESSSDDDTPDPNLPNQDDLAIR